MNIETLFARELRKNLKQIIPGIMYRDYYNKIHSCEISFVHEEEPWRITISYEKEYRFFTVNSYINSPINDPISTRDKAYAACRKINKYLIEFANTHDIDCIIGIENEYYCDPTKMIAHGESSLHIVDLYKTLQETLPIVCYPSGAYLTGSFTAYNIKPNFEEQSVHILKNGTIVDILKNKIDVERFILSQEEMRKELVQAEDALVHYAQQLEPSAYYNRKSKSGSYLYMLGDKIPFSITEIGGIKGVKYKLNFDRKTNVAKTKEQIEIKARERIQNYYKKNRLKAITSKDVNMIERHLFTMLHERKTEKQFTNKLICLEVSYPEFRLLLSKADPNQLKTGHKEEAAWFLNLMKKNHKRYKLKSSYRLENYRIFITASAYFVFDENKLKTYSFYKK